MSKLSTVSTMSLDGGDACLDFVNSGYDRDKGIVTERLHSYDDLLILTGRLALFNQAHLDALKKEALKSQKAAEQAMLFARDCRQKLYDVFTAVAQRRLDQLDPEVVTDLNQLFVKALRFDLLQINKNELQFSFQPVSDDLLSPVYRLLLSSYELLKKGDLQLIKQCLRCSWLFIDNTKNHRKKWCSMVSCGNAQKIKRYYDHRKTKPV
jgi:predicted RNA-binding Zn ribbon-like protein